MLSSLSSCRSCNLNGVQQGTNNIESPVRQFSSLFQKEISFLTQQHQGQADGSRLWGESCCKTEEGLEVQLWLCQQRVLIHRECIIKYSEWECYSKLQCPHWQHWVEKVKPFGLTIGHFVCISLTFYRSVQKSAPIGWQPNLNFGCGDEGRPLVVQIRSRHSCQLKYQDTIQNTVKHKTSLTVSSSRCLESLWYFRKPSPWGNRKVRPFT